MWREIFLQLKWNFQPVRRFKRWTWLLFYGIWHGYQALDIKRRRGRTIIAAINNVNEIRIHDSVVQNGKMF